jgi:hypothetical protein
MLALPLDGDVLDDLPILLGCESLGPSVVGCRTSGSSVSAPAPASSAPAGIARPDLLPAESGWHQGPARRGSEPSKADRSDAPAPATAPATSETAARKERRSPDEAGSSDEAASSKPTTEAGTSSKPSAEARTPSKPTPEAPAAEAATAEAPAGETPAVEATTTTTKSRLRRSRYQRGADYCRYGERGEFLVNHGSPPPLDIARPYSVNCEFAG